MTLDSTILATGMTIVCSAMATVFVYIFRTLNKAESNMKGMQKQIEHLEKSDESQDRKIEDISIRQDQKYEKLTEMLIDMKEAFSDMRVELQNKANR